MVKEILTERQRIDVKEHVVEYEHKDGRDKGWYSFKTDPIKGIIYKNEMQKRNVEMLNNSPDYIGPIPRVIDRSYIQPTKAICECNSVIFLEDQYMGASQCPSCGRWHNMFGQTLKDPEYWEVRYEDED